MAIIRAQVTLKTTDANEANYASNVFAFNTGAATNPEVVGTTLLKDFYDDLYTYFSVAIAQNGHTIKWYDLPLVAPPNYPFAETTFDLTSAPFGTPLPSETALCVSFQGAYITGLPQRRRRGRIYLGPLSTSVAGTAGEVGRPSTTARTNIATAAGDFRTAVNASTFDSWVVWSTVDQNPVAITDGWVDNAYDTQRRRGLPATSRITF